METTSATDLPDVVSDVLDTVRVRSTVYCRSDMRAPWGFGVQAHGNPSFHVVTRGECWLEVDGENEPVKLTAGELVLLPHGPLHWVRAEPASPTLWLDEILAGTPPDGHGRLRHGGSGAMTELVCGGFVLEGRAANPILAKLPAVIRVARDETGPARWLAATLELVGTLTQSNGPGPEAVLARVADTMLTQVLRLELASRPTDRATLRVLERGILQPRIQAGLRSRPGARTARANAGRTSARTVWRRRRRESRRSCHL